MTNDQEEPEPLSCEWHARMHDVAANASIELMRSAPDTASVRDFHAEADSHRDSAAKLRSIPGLEARVVELEELVAELANCRDRNRLMRLQEQAEQMTKETTDE